MTGPKSRSQASLFDGITFLFLAMLSVAVVFTALSDYGNLQQSVINKAHLSNYLQSAFKSVYYIDTSALSGVSCRDEPEYCIDPESCRNSPGDLNCKMGCEKLADWMGVSVAELIKRDMRDYSPADPSTGLDDRYGPADAPGKLAARCAFKEILKPFSTGGYSYFVEFRRISGSNNILVPQAAPNITNNRLVTSCDQELGKEKFVVNTPFRVFRCGDSAEGCWGENYVMTVCLWPTRKTS